MHDQQAVPLEGELTSSAQVLGRLSALAEEISAALSGQAVGGRHLVAALSDQLAEGQVETLYTLHTASADLRHRSDDVVAAAQQLTGAGAELISVARGAGTDLAVALGDRLAREALTAGEVIKNQLGQGLGLVQVGVAEGAAQLNEAHERLTRSAGSLADLLTTMQDQAAVGLGEAKRIQSDAAADLLRAVQRVADDLTAAATVAADALAMTLETRLAVETVAAGLELQRQAGLASDLLREAVQDGLRGLTAGADQVGVAQQQLTTSADKVTSALEVAAVRWPIAARQVRDDLLDAGRTAVTAVDGAGSRIDVAAAQLQVLADGLVSRLDTLRDDVIGVSEQTVDDLQLTTSGLIEALQTQVRTQERRDALVDRKVQERVQQLVARTDAAVAALTASFAVEVARLVDRDATLEKQRVEEFTRVLDQVLSQPGLRRRGLRSRIRQILATPAPAPEAAPIVGSAPLAVPVPATPVVEPSVLVPSARRPRKTASPKKEDAT